MALVDGRAARLWSLIANEAPPSEPISTATQCRRRAKRCGRRSPAWAAAPTSASGGAGSWVLADPESAVMVLGPPRSGKTSAVMIPAVMGASGAVIATSTKPDVMRATVAARSEIGQAWLFDPAAQSNGCRMACGGCAGRRSRRPAPGTRRCDGAGDDAPARASAPARRTRATGQSAPPRCSRRCSTPPT